MTYHTWARAAMSNVEKHDYITEHYRSKETMKDFVSWIL